jgi:hypothetical protein
MLWYHAFNRNTTLEIMKVLIEEAHPNPDPDCRTQRNERALGISAPHTYAYLGRPCIAFGQTAVALMLDSLAFTVSPFDTGGLVENLPPVASLPSGERQAYLQAYSWPSTHVHVLLGEHPGPQPERVKHYRTGVPPAAAGPYEVWARADGADIWRRAASSTKDYPWRAWMWEARVAGPIAMRSKILAWSCPSHIYEELRVLAEGLTDPADVAAFEDLVDKYVDGGVIALARAA